MKNSQLLFYRFLSDKKPPGKISQIGDLTNSLFSTPKQSQIFVDANGKLRINKTFVNLNGETIYNNGRNSHNRFTEVSSFNSLSSPTYNRGTKYVTKQPDKTLKNYISKSAPFYSYSNTLFVTGNKQNRVCCTTCKPNITLKHFYAEP